MLPAKVSNNEMPKDEECYHEDDALGKEMVASITKDCLNVLDHLDGEMKEVTTVLTPAPPDEVSGQTVVGESSSTVTPDKKRLKLAPRDELGGSIVPLLRKKVEGGIKIIPTRDMTGVEEEYTLLCATLSHQLYEAKTGGDFNLSRGDLEVDVVLFDDHGKLANTTPPFAVVATGDTMVIGWRGSQTVMDWVFDLGFAPVASSRWMETGKKSVRAQGAMSALAQNDLSLHRDEILAEIKARGIRRLLITGHSLGGGIAQVAHLCIAGEMEDNASPWRAKGVSGGELEVRTVAFSAPMTTVNINRSGDKVSRDFIDSVGRQMSNIIFAMDPVPRAYGDLGFISQMLDDAVPQLVKGIDIPFVLGWTRGIIKNKVVDLVDFAKGRLEQTIEVSLYFRHIGSVVYYASADDQPVRYEDKGFHYVKPEGSSQVLFNSIKYKKPAAGASILDVATNDHLFLVSASGLSYAEINA